MGRRGGGEGREEKGREKRRGDRQRWEGREGKGREGSDWALQLLLKIYYSPAVLGNQWYLGRF